MRFRLKYDEGIISLPHWDLNLDPLELITSVLPVSYAGPYLLCWNMQAVYLQNIFVDFLTRKLCGGWVGGDVWERERERERKRGSLFVRKEEEKNK